MIRYDGAGQWHPRSSASPGPRQSGPYREAKGGGGGGAGPGLDATPPPCDQSKTRGWWYWGMPVHHSHAAFSEIDARSRMGQAEGRRQSPPWSCPSHHRDRYLSKPVGGGSRTRTGPAPPGAAARLEMRPSWRVAMPSGIRGGGGQTPVSGRLRHRIPFVIRRHFHLIVGWGGGD